MGVGSGDIMTGDNHVATSATIVAAVATAAFAAIAAVAAATAYGAGAVLTL